MTIALLIFGIFLTCSTSAALEPAKAIVPFDLVDGITFFARNLKKHIFRAAPGDIISSPFSAQTVLALALQGAAGQTAQELITGLGYANATSASIAASYRSALAPMQNSPILTMVNKIYLQQGYSINSEFNRVATENFYSSADQVDFAQADITSGKINSYVASKTNNLIQDLISPSAISVDTRMLLVNAIHFKGKWTKSFDKDATYDETFYTDSETSAEIPTMHITDIFNYADLPEFDAKMIEFQYVNSTVSMVVILPNQVDGFNSLQSKLENVSLYNALSTILKPQKVIVSFPKFKTEFSVNLNDALSKMEMSTMFTKDANFNNMLKQPEALQVTSILQKAIVEVNEEGAEAAAATGMTFGITSIVEQNETPLPTFKANHPFIYCIQERYEFPYFAGRFMNKASN